MNQDETEESGPIIISKWDFRTRENSEWCSGCKKWLRLLAFTHMDKNERLSYHQKEYCKNHPSYDPSDVKDI